LASLSKERAAPPPDSWNAREQSDAKRHRVANTFVSVIIATAPDAMLIVDGNGRIILVNEETERLFGHPAAEVPGQLVELLIRIRIRMLTLDTVCGTSTSRAGGAHSRFAGEGWLR
jgi:PAS domain-containing protein